MSACLREVAIYRGKLFVGYRPDLPIHEQAWRNSALRWSGKFGQEAKLGSPWRKDGPDDGEAEALHGGVQSKDCS
jgi:hypothetical protein